MLALRSVSLALCRRCVVSPLHPRRCRHPRRLSTQSTSSPASAPAISADDFARLLRLAGVPRSARLAVALSGGADSSALTLLAHEWASSPANTAPPILALQVDHDLRAESSAEVEHCAAWLAARNIAHRRLALQWVERPSLGRLQEVARQRRYAALTSACDDAGVSHLLVGHHLQDQQETFLHRFTRASGIEGLAAMAPSLVLSTSSQPQLHLCRPLLSIPKSRLLSTCHRFDLHHLIDDPSNRNPAFERIRIRDVLGAMQREEEGRKVLAQLAEVQSVVKRVGQDVKQRVSNVFRRWMRVEQPLGVWVIKARVWQVEGEELMVAVLSRLLFIVRGGTYRPINSAVVDLVRRIRRGDLHPLLCAGCVLRPLPGEGQATMPRTLLVTRANTAVEMAVEGGGRMEWDHRYVLHLTPPQGWAAGQWQWLVRALRPTTDLLGRFKVHERRGRALLHHNLPVLVRRKRGPADARGRVEEEVVCIPHLPHLPLAQGLHRWHGWLVKLEQLHSETPEWD